MRVMRTKVFLWVLVGSLIATFVLLHYLCTPPYRSRGGIGDLAWAWLFFPSPLLSIIFVTFVEELRYNWFGVKNVRPFFLFKAIFANLIITIFMVIIVFFVYVYDDAFSPLYIYSYMTPWMIILGESVLLCALFYFNPEGKFVDVYAGKAFVIDNAAEKQEILTDANAIMRCLDEIEELVECDRRLGHKHEDFYSVLEKLRENKYYLTEEEYKLILKRIDDCVSTSENGMVNYLEITMRLKQYWSEAKKYKSKCDTKQA